MKDIERSNFLYLVWQVRDVFRNTFSIFTHQTCLAETLVLWATFLLFFYKLKPFVIKLTTV